MKRIGDIKMSLVLFGTLLLFAAVSIVQADSPYWDSSWSYRKQVAITNNVATTLYDYSMMITLNTSDLISAGKMQSDCGDIRVIENGVEINYGIKNPNSASTEIYFIANDLSTGSNNDIYIYYGNPNADNGFVENWKDAFYIWWDDFDTDRGWYDYFARGVSWSINNGELTVNFAPYVDGVIAPSDGSSFPMDGRVGIKTEARMKVLNNRWCQGLISLSWQYTVHHISVGHSRYQLAFSDLISKSLSTNTWYIAETVYNRLTGDWYCTFDGELTTGNRPALESDDFSTIMIASCNGTTPVVDYIYLRYFIEPEPGCSLGEEEATVIEALIDIDPDTLNRKSHGKWVTVYITLPDGYDVGAIDTSSIAITSLVGVSCDPEYTQGADLSFVPQVGDRDEDGIADLTVKFDRQVLLANLCLDDVSITIEGELTTGELFSGSDSIRIIDRGK